MLEQPKGDGVILVVDDAPATVEVLERNLAGAGYRVLTAGDAESALAVLAVTPVDVVVTDLKMPRVTGMEVVRFVREHLPDTEVMMITGYATIEGAVEAVKSGAEEYLAKPFTDEELFGAVGRVFAKLSQRRASRLRTVRTPGAPDGLLGESSVMTAVLEALSAASRSSAPLLLAGEPGTGKTLAAQTIHFADPTRSGPLVVVDCAGIPSDRLTHELFPDPADTDRPSLLAAARGGTVLLEEVTALPPTVQEGILEVVEGIQSTSPNPAPVTRLVGTTQRKLEDLGGADILRQPLTAQLEVRRVDLPPLRHRGGDVLLLARHFARRLAGEQGWITPVILSEAQKMLSALRWPGNVRELEWLLEQAVRRAGNGGEISGMTLRALLSTREFATDDAAKPLAEVEAEHVQRVVAACRGNKTRAAQILGIDRKTLREKLRSLNPSG